jgi:hypothetical protein
MSGNPLCDAWQASSDEQRREELPMSHHFSNRDLSWRVNDLYVGGSSRPLVSIEQDKAWPGMWRVRHGDKLSDMTNITRVRDAARSVALAILNAEGRPEEGRLGASPMRLKRKADVRDVQQPLRA